MTPAVVRSVAPVVAAGDHANRQQDFSGPYQAEIEYLAAAGVKPDLAFMRISPYRL